MQRRQNAIRPQWRDRVINSGLVYVDTEDPATKQVFSYWTEDAHYLFTEEEIEVLRQMGKELTAMFVAAGDYIIENDLFAKLGIPTWIVPAIKKTWQDDDPQRYWPSWYGRFDVRWGGISEGDTPRLLEYNADTPTCLPESTAAQWEWLQEQVVGQQQWNDTYEMLVEATKRNLRLYERRSGRPISTVHIAYSSDDKSGEDQMNATWIAAAIEEAGFKVKFVFMEDIQLQESNEELVTLPGTTELIKKGYFLDQDGMQIHVIFKLYPWEWIFDEAFGKTIAWNILQDDGTVWIEPPYKAMWSNKGVLPVLWHLYKDDPVRRQYLLPAYFAGEEPEGFADNAARKPLLGREGANVTLTQGGQVLAAAGGEYGTEGYILQQLAPLPEFEGIGGPWHPVLGLWCIDNDGFCGMGIRESPNYITDNQSRFIPHKYDVRIERNPQ